MARPREEARPEYVPPEHRRFGVDFCAECANSCILWGDWAAHFTAPGAEYDDGFLKRKFLEFGLTEEDWERARQPWEEDPDGEWPDECPAEGCPRSVEPGSRNPYCSAHRGEWAGPDAATIGG